MSRFLKVISLSFLIFHFSFLIVEAAPPAKFPPVSGEINGQASPGVKSITINGKGVSFDADNNFHSVIKLKEGEKYLTLVLSYEDLRVIKKYLILRKSPINVFKVFVPKEKIEKTIQAIKAERKISERIIRRKPSRLKKARVKRAPPRKIASAALVKPSKTYEYLYAWEFSEGKLLVVKESNGKYSAEINIPATRKWLDLKGVSKEELREMMGVPSKESSSRRK